MSAEPGRRTIVVGAGTGGATVAARVSEDPHHEVVLIEAGPDYPDPTTIPLDLRQSNRLSLAEHDWGLQAYYVEPPQRRNPMPYARGRVVGGSSAVNGCIAVRASVADHDEWVAAGNDEWSWTATLPYFKRVESDLDMGSTPWHGASGPVPVRRYRRDELAPIAEAFEQACLDRDHPLLSDMNAPGATGVGPVPRSLVGDERGSALVTYLAEARGRANLTILADTQCHRVLFVGTRAVGVEVERAGQVEEVLADDIVLAAGAIHTPQILTLSGVAAADDLARLGIAPISILPGVGRHLRDHVNVPTLGLLREETGRMGARNQLTFSSQGHGMVNDLLLVPTAYDPTGRGLAIPDDVKTVFSLTTVLARPFSTGWIDVVDADVAAPPEIHTNYLSHPGDLDRLEQGVRLANEILRSWPVCDYLTEIISPGPDVLSSAASLREWMVDSATTVWHATSTCRMGPDGDEGAVVDQRLAVRGTQHLWVGDASALPNVPTALTNLTVHMLAERLAEWLRSGSGPSLDPT